MLAAGPASAASFPPAADSHVRGDYPDGNWGTSSSLRVDGSPSSTAYLRFSVDGVDGPIRAATLKVFAKRTVTPSGVDLRPVLGDWSEAGLTYRNAPAVGGVIGHAGAAEEGQWVSIDATPLVKGNGRVDLALTTKSETARRFASREEDDQYAPRLVVDTMSDPGPRPEYRGAQTHPLWGRSEEGFIRELDRLKEAGADTVRFDIGWASLEREGDDDYSSTYIAKADAVFEAAAARGIKVITTFWSTPCWASSAPDTLKQDCSGAWWDRDVQKYPPSDPGEYSEAAAFVANRWGDKMAAFEVWNEPDEANQSFLVSPNPAYDYAQIVKSAYRPLKEAQPTLPVIVGSTTFANRVFLERLYDYGIQPYHDGISIHPYNEKRDPDLHAEPEFVKWSYRDGVPWVRDLMLERGDADKGLWLTELGWTTCNDYTSKFCVTENQQEKYVNDAFRIQREDRWDYVKAMIVYNLRNKGTDPGDREDQYGLLRRDFTPKPSWSYFTDALARW